MYNKEKIIDLEENSDLNHWFEFRDFRALNFRETTKGALLSFVGHFAISRSRVDDISHVKGIPHNCVYPILGLEFKELIHPLTSHSALTHVDIKIFNFGKLEVYNVLRFFLIRQSNVFEGLTFCLTNFYQNRNGVSPFRIEAYKNFIQLKGGTIAEKMSNKVDFLIVGDCFDDDLEEVIAGSKDSFIKPNKKIRFAISRNIPILNLNHLRKLVFLRQHGK